METSLCVLYCSEVDLCFFFEHAILALCLIMSCIGFYSRTSTICSIWCAPQELLPAPQSPPAAMATSLRRAQPVPRWVKHTLLTPFHLFHQQHVSFHHPAHRCNLHLPEELRKALFVFLWRWIITQNLLCLVTAPSKL